MTTLLNLGDMVGKGPRGREVVDRCRELRTGLCRGLPLEEAPAGT